MNDSISAGFAIDLYPEHVIEANVEDAFDPRHGIATAAERAEALAEGVITDAGELTEKGWEWLNDDDAKLERAALGWLRANFIGARDEGHGGHGGEELIGTFWVNPRSKKQMALLAAMESSDGVDLGLLVPSAWRSLSKLGNALGGRIFAFDVDKSTTFAERARER